MLSFVFFFLFLKGVLAVTCEIFHMKGHVCHGKVFDYFFFMSIFFLICSNKSKHIFIMAIVGQTNPLLQQFEFVMNFPFQIWFKAMSSHRDVGFFFLRSTLNVIWVTITNFKQLCARIQRIIFE